MSPEEIAQGQLDAYNRQDIDAFMTFYADDVVIADLNGKVQETGAAQVRERYLSMFAKFPQNRAELINRIVSGNIVVDHEDVHRSPDQRFRGIAIYTIAGDKIARVDFAG
jgi:hypothetical protein